MQTRPPRPTGITVLAILSILIGIFLLLVGIASLSLSAIGGISGVSNASYVVAAGAFSLILGILGLAMGIGFLHGKRYGWDLGVIVSVLMIIGAIVLIALGSYGNIVQLIIYGIVLYYLTRPHVKAFFGKGPSVAMPITTPSPGMTNPSMMGSTMGSSSMGSMRCSSCGANVPTGSTKCPSCGASL